MNTSGKISFKLLFITDRNLSDRSLPAIIKSACSCGLKVVQIREKDLPAGNLLKLARVLRSITKKHNAKLIINDRLDIALLSIADGVNVPVKGINRQIISKFSNKLFAGKSVHSLKDALIAEKEGFDYISFGPVFRTPAKIKYGSPQGLSKLKQICSKIKIPVFAVGGITPSRTKKCLQAGAYGVAVIKAIMKSENIIKTINDFKYELGTL